MNYLTFINIMEYLRERAKSLCNDNKLPTIDEAELMIQDATNAAAAITNQSNPQFKALIAKFLQDEILKLSAPRMDTRGRI